MQGALPSSRQEGARGRLRDLGLTACLALLVLAAGCGSAPVETDPMTTGAPPAESVPPPAVAPAESGLGEQNAARINLYLAQQFLYENWYPRISDIAVAGQRALVSAVLASTPRGRAMAREICGAVISSHRVRAVRVSFSRTSVACP